MIEHLRREQQPRFFATLVRLTTRGVVLCNPTDTGAAKDRQRFLLSVYGPMKWIVEHLECHTPTIAEFEDLAARHDLELHVYPNGNRFLSMSMFGMKYFANASHDPELRRQCTMLERYINRHRHLQDSPACPRDYAYVFKKKAAPTRPGA